MSLARHVVEAAPIAARAPKTAKTSSASPIIKWVGGKGRLLPALLDHAPERFKTYFEPFAGGAALFFALAPRKAQISDCNADLIGMYTAVAQEVDAVIEHLEHHRAAHSSTHYYEQRSRWNDRTTAWEAGERGATFIYLNKTCFNGLWRVNRSGEFNVPMGRYENPALFDEDELRAAGQALAHASIRHCEFATAVAKATAGDFVYFDPPYVPLTATANFTSYTADSFGMDKQEELAELVHHLAERKCQVLLSNSDTPAVRKLYKRHSIERVYVSRAINSRADARGPVAEVLVRTY